MSLSPLAIHRLSPIEESSILTQKNYPQIATIPESKVGKIILTNKQIEQFDNLAFQLNSGSGLITMEEAILKLRGGDGWTSLVDIIALVIIMNYYNSFVSIESFQVNPLPHHDPFG